MTDKQYVIIISEKTASKLQEETNSFLSELNADGCEIKDIKFVVDAGQALRVMIVYTQEE